MCALEDDICNIQEQLRQLSLGEDEVEYIIEDEIIYRILSIDVGIKHLGISISIADEEFKLKEVLFMDLLDITKFPHREGKNIKNCTLHHSKTFSDWMEHVFVLYEEYFEQCEYILIERQPPMGLVAVEQLVFSKYREKSHLISPNSMHKFFNIGGLDYDQRKTITEKICRRKITNPELIKQYDSFFRKHDIADTVCIMLFWLSQKHKELVDYQRMVKIRNTKMVYRNTKMTMNEWFEQFKYVPSLEYSY